MWSSGWTLRNYLFPNFPMCRFEVILDEETSLVHTAISSAICVNSKYLEQCLAHRRCSVSLSKGDDGKRNEEDPCP